MRSKYEIKAQKELEAEGWLVDYKIRPSRYYKGQTIDFFGLFDLCAVKREENIRFISIKGHAGVPRSHTQAVEAFWVPRGVSKEIWIWPNNKKKKQWIKKVIS